MAPRFLPSNISRSPRPSFGNDTSPLMVGQPAGYPTIMGTVGGENTSRKKSRRLQKTQSVPRFSGGSGGGI